MRFTTTWAEIASQNVTLKVFIACLTVMGIVLSITATKLAIREPVVIDRACETTSAALGSIERTETEMKGFAEKALAQRFNSDTKDTSFLALKEREAREREQESLTSKGITQRIFINHIRIEKNKILVDSDRLISVQKIRSAFIFPLIVQISKVSRSTSNPYGLLLASVEQVKIDEEKK